MAYEQSKVLIVDDDISNIKILAEILKSQHKIFMAKTGQQALEIIISRSIQGQASSLPDLILLDIIMPDMDGYEVCQRLKSVEETKDIPIIFVTAQNSIAEETKGLQLGAVDYISKPFSPEIVKARVATHVELKRQRDMLAQLNMIDSLTGINNRRRFDKYIHDSWERASRSKSCLSLIMIDVDYFKAFNDQYGHSCGDQCLIKIAQALAQSTKRTGDLVARFGGEEFAVILPDCSQKDSVKLALLMRDNIVKLSIPHLHSSANEFVSASFGVASFLPDHTSSCPEIIKAADAALYQAKEKGRNCVVSNQE